MNTNSRKDAKIAKPVPLGALGALARVLLAAALLTACKADAATIYGNISSVTGSGYATNITFRPISAPLEVNQTLYVRADVTNVTSAAGNFTNALVAGDYQMFIGSNPRNTVVIGVPDDNGTYNFTTLIETTLTYPYSSPPAARTTLSGMTDITLGASIAEGDGLVYNTTTARWTNSPLSGGGGFSRYTNTADVGISIVTNSASNFTFSVSASLRTLSSNNAANLTNWNIFDSNTVSRTIYLATNGNDATARINDRSRPFATITNAFLRVTNNTVLEIMDAGPYVINPAGNFNSDLARPEPLQIVGSSNVLVRGTGNSIIYGAGASNMLLIANSRNVRLEGLTFRNNRAGFDGSPGSLFTAIYMFNTNNYVEVDRCRFEDLGNHAIIFGSVSTADKATFYLTVQNSFFSMVGNSTVRDGTCIGIPRGPSRILNNTFLDCLRPIEFEGVYGALVSSNHLVMGNYIDRYRDIAISHFDDGGTTNNYVDVKIVDNFILNGIAETNGAGVAISATAGVNRWEISHNFIHGAADYGISFGAGATCTKIIGNTIEGTVNWAIAAATGGLGLISNVVSGNIVNSCSYGINWAGDSNLISGNVFNGISGFALVISGTGNRVKGNQIFYPGTPGSGPGLVINSTATNTIVEGNESVGVPLRSPSNLGVATRFINNHEETNQFWFHYGLRESNGVTFVSNAVLRGAVQVLDLTGSGDTLSLTANGTIQRTNITGGAGSQTPWASAIDAATYNLESLGDIRFDASVGYRLWFTNDADSGIYVEATNDGHGFWLSSDGYSNAVFQGGAVDLRRLRRVTLLNGVQYTTNGNVLAHDANGNVYSTAMTGGGGFATGIDTTQLYTNSGGTLGIKSDALVTNLVLNGGTNAIANGSTLTNAGWIVSPAASRVFYGVNGSTNAGLGASGGNVAIFGGSSTVLIQGTSSSTLRAVTVGGNNDASGNYIGLSDFGPRWMEMTRQGSFAFTNAFTAGQAVTNRTYGVMDLEPYSNIIQPPRGARLGSHEAGTIRVHTNLVVVGTSTVTNGFINPIAALATNTSVLIVNFGPTNEWQSLTVSGPLEINFTNFTAGVKRKFRLTFNGQQNLTNWLAHNPMSPLPTAGSNNNVLNMEFESWGTTTNDIDSAVKFAR